MYSVGELSVLKNCPLAASTTCTQTPFRVYHRIGVRSYKVSSNKEGDIHIIRGDIYTYTM